MGIANYALYMMMYAVKNGVDFSHTITIGRQTCYATQSEIRNLLVKYDSPHPKAIDALLEILQPTTHTWYFL
ncbi:hypothetical protein FACS189461_3660 [Spirochaetia bacterium]|nr:hypothetical protein FACS189461_3660 [Spirochaetia bacterium]